MFNAKKLMALLLCLVMVLSLVACGGGNNSSGGNNAGGNDSSDAAEEKTVVFGLSKTWETMRVPDFINGATYQVGAQIFDKLIYLDEQNQVHPRGADSWEWAADGMSLTFYLNKDAKFHDGEPVTAEDYVFSYKFHATNEVQFQNRAGTKYLVGADATTGIELEPDVLGVEAVDDYTLKLNFNGVYNQTSFMASALNSLFALPSHLFEGMSDTDIYNSEFWNAPVGSGPCIYDSEVTDSSITLKANKDYHLGAPQFDTLIMQVIDTNTAVDKILSGDVDILGFNLSTEVAQQYLEDEDISIVSEPTPSTLVNLCFNNLRVPKKIRQAVDRGMDKQDILNKIYGGNGVINYSMVFPNYPGYTEKDIYNKAEAADLVKQAIADGDWSADSKLIIGVVNPIGENAATLIKAQMAEIGLNVEIKMDEMATIQKAMIVDQGQGSDFQYSAAIWTVGSVYVPTKMLNVYAMFANSLFFHNETEKITPIFAAYMSAQDAETEKAAIEAFQAWELEETPQSTIVQYGAYSATAPHIGNVDLFNVSNFNQASWLWTVE